MGFKIGDSIEIPAEVRPACGGCIARISTIQGLLYTDKCSKGARHCLGKAELKKCSEEEDKRFV